MPHRFEETLVQNQDKIIISVRLLFSVIEAGYLHFYKPLTIKTKKGYFPFSKHHRVCILKNFVIQNTR